MPEMLGHLYVGSRLKVEVLTTPKLCRCWWGGVSRIWRLMGVIADICGDGASRKLVGRGVAEVDGEGVSRIWGWVNVSMTAAGLDDISKRFHLYQ